MNRRAFLTTTAAAAAAVTMKAASAATVTPAAVSVNENQTTVMTVTATDPDDNSSGGGGPGTSTVGEKTFNWGPRDIFVAPSWHPVSHAANEDSVLFSFSDRPVQKMLGLWREETLA